ncbi:hypothetical protein CYLTODRAFT_419114 [Cylindrobasidium torrendii FP15055 ss-10]|uniref:Zn(2)-C6 fungal-type domain-containing protein n=1 Tax=Cylindrobasidium torrendii FP15055 ss-10 TaxID=1314674 RepID=A0A0D7BLL0_9AGAR|nr:hypothetical protein CYLTODRAFT_419114 [Cylindrobasidium torrendii FP15055 ss-10]
MDDSLQFIIESPQTTQGQKKRPRLVTSCDNCRLKKIKCLQPVPEAKCEACRTAKIACAFRDRERYFAERSRAIAGPQFDDGGRRGSSDSSLDGFPVSPAPRSKPRREEDGRPRFPSFSSDGSNHSSSPYQSPRHTPYSYNPNPVPSSFYRSASPPVPGALPLFDAEQQHPHPSLMQNFISVLFEQMANDFSFLTYAEVMTEFMERRITPLLSNSLAAFATPYTTIPELANRGLHNVANAYADHAKQILMHSPNQCLDTVHGLIMLSWFEANNNRMTAFRQYYGMLMNMSVDLGLNDDSIPPQAQDPRKRETWAAVLRLHAFYTERHLSQGSS